jgi:hypothetical protein
MVAGRWSTYETGADEMWDFGEGPQGWRTLQIPYWLLTVVSLAGFLAVLRINRRELPDGVSRCAKCGYDLRFTPDRCAECGALPAPRGLD